MELPSCGSCTTCLQRSVSWVTWILTIMWKLLTAKLIKILLLQQTSLKGKLGTDNLDDWSRPQVAILRKAGCECKPDNPPWPLFSPFPMSDGDGDNCYLIYLPWCLHMMSKAKARWDPKFLTLFSNLHRSSNSILFNKWLDSREWTSVRISGSNRFSHLVFLLLFLFRGKCREGHSLARHFTIDISLLKLLS